jgi:nickel-dependent lactate racemase
MRKISFDHYKGFPGAAVDDRNLLGVFTPKSIEKKASTEELILKAFANPIESPPLLELAKGKRQVLILADDNTRTTPMQEIIPAILKELKAAGVENKNASLLVALGTHREMTQDEKEKKFGRSVCETLPIHMHRWDREDELCDLGTTEGGTQILLNKRLMEADLVIGVGQIVPHRVAGYSGGCKIIQPGVCGAVTTGQTHWLSAKFTGEEIMGKIDNPVREEMNRVGLRANLKFIVNAVMDLSDEIVDAVCGDPIAAFKKGARLSSKIFGVEVPEKADIVLTDSYPADLEMWQASKGIYAADLAVKEGGVIVMISPCYEGVCAEHPDILRYGYLPYDAVRKLVDSSEIKDLTLAAHLIHVGRVIKEKATGILVAPGIEPVQAETLGFMTAQTPQKGLDLAFKIAGSDASVSVLQHAGHILPLIRR